MRDAVLEFDLGAEIVPGCSAAGVPLGMPGEALPPGGSVETFENGWERRKWPDVGVLIREERVRQISVRGAYRGVIRGSMVGIGSTIGDVEQSLGTVEYDEEDNLVVLAVPGWCFETGLWKGQTTPWYDFEKKDLDARIMEIYVYHPEGE